jgi:hypothetical protein
VFPGFSLGLRRNLGERCFIGAGLSSLPKDFTVSAFGTQDQWQFSGLLLGLSAGCLVQQSGPCAVLVQAQAGWLDLTNGSLTRSPDSSGSAQGSAPALELSAGERWNILPSVALELVGGWRLARVPVALSLPGGPAEAPASRAYVDFSGPFAKLGLAFTWGLRNPWGESEAPPPPPPPRDF